MEFIPYTTYLRILSVSAHYWHLKTLSEPQHRALGLLYEELPDLFDKLCEQYMGRYQQRITIPNDFKLIQVETSADIMSELDNALRESDKIALDKLCKFVDMQNTVADIIALINKVRYLLSFNSLKYEGGSI
jgi:hypothetical protein